jgi:aspartate racemase
MGLHNHPEVSMHTFPLAAYNPGIDGNDWQPVADLMLGSAKKLALAGADFLICPDNTIHQAMPLLAGKLPLPWLHIADAVIDETRARGFHRIGLLGTRSLVLSSVYSERLIAAGMDCVRPTDEEREQLSWIIMNELVCGIFRPESIAAYLRVVERMKSAGCDAVILGCTEIPLILNDGNSPLPVLDSTRLLARAALRRALESSGF